MSGVTPLAASASSSRRRCVVEPGWMTSDFASPTFARCESSSQASMKRRAGLAAAGDAERHDRALARAAGSAPRSRRTASRAGPG